MGIIMELQLNITDPDTGMKLIITAQEAELGNKPGWSVTMGNAAFFMIMERGQWRITQGQQITNDLLDLIGCYLHPLALRQLINFASQPCGN